MDSFPSGFINLLDCKKVKILYIDLQVEVSYKEKFKI